MKELMLKRKGMLLCCAMALGAAALVGVGVAQANAADLVAVEDETPTAVAVDDKKTDAIDEAEEEAGAFEGEAELPADEGAANASEDIENVELVAVESEAAPAAQAKASEAVAADNLVEVPENGEVELVDEAQGERIDEEPPELEECPASELD